MKLLRPVAFASAVLLALSACRADEITGPPALVAEGPASSASVMGTGTRVDPATDPNPGDPTLSN